MPPAAPRDPAARHAAGLVACGAARLRRDMLDEAVARTAATSNVVPLRPIIRHEAAVTAPPLGPITPLPVPPVRADRRCPPLQPRAP
jgi:hypothetical protein